MIRRIRLQDFKTHADTTVELGRLTVLVGPNGCGKTSVLSALHEVSQLPRTSFHSIFADDRHPQHLIRRGSHGFGLSLDGDGWSLALNAPLKPEGHVIPELYATLDGNPPALLNLEQYPQRPQFGIPPLIVAAITSTVSVRLDARSLARPAPLTDHPQLGIDGFGLAAVIAAMLLDGSDRLRAIVDDVRRVVPQVCGLRVRTVNLSIEGGRPMGHGELLVDFDGARGVPAHAVSEGTLIAIGLLTLLHGEARPRLILLDDIDQTLHPKAQWELVGVLRRMMKSDLEVQIVATTHSPYLVDKLEAEEVRVMALDANGISHCRALSDHPRAAALLEVLSTGELLGAEGEDWVVGGDGDA